MIDLTYERGIQYIEELSIKYSSYNSHSVGFDFDKYYELVNSNSDSKLWQALESVSRKMPDSLVDYLYYSQILYYQISRVLFPGIVSVLPSMIHDDWLGSLSYEISSRDHIIHQPMVAFIANQLLSIRLPKTNDTLMEWIVNSFKQDKDSLFKYLLDYMKTLGMISNGEIRDTTIREVIETTITIATLYHDIGYPWQFVNKLSNTLEGVPNIVSGVHFNCKQFVETYQDRLFFLPFHGYQSNITTQLVNQHLIELAANNTHSLYSSLCLLTLKDSMASYPKIPSLYDFCVEWAALGVLMHDFGRVYALKGEKEKNIRPRYPFLRLSFSKDPISSLLVLSDYLQEFKRPRAKFFKMNGVVSVEYEYNCEKCTVEINDNQLLIEFYYKELTIELERDALAERDRLFDRHYGFLDLSDIGITEVQVKCIKIKPAD